MIAIGPTPTELPPTPAELADFIKSMRETNKWTQATLAEIAGVAERTIQRVENAEPSTLDTRRALAGAFGCKDLDIFDKPWPRPDPEKLKAEMAESVAVAIRRVREGRTLRTMVEGTSAFATDEVGELSGRAREAFAEMVDYLRDYNDISAEYSMRERLVVDGELDAFLSTISKERAAIGVGVRHGNVRFPSDAAGLPALDLTIIQFVLAPHDTLPSTVRVPKRQSCAFA